MIRVVRFSIFAEANDTDIPEGELLEEWIIEQDRQTFRYKCRVFYYLPDGSGHLHEEIIFVDINEAYQAFLLKTKGQ